MSWRSCGNRLRMVSYEYNLAGVLDLNALAALAVRVMPARGSWGAHERLPTVALAWALSEVTREGRPIETPLG
jgi:hypothetical protein